MSSAITQSSGIFSVSHNFAFKWSLKAKVLNDLGNSENASAIRSDLYQFKTAKDLRFFLEIPKPDSYFNINIRGSEMWSFKIAYAFVVGKERAFYLKTNLLWFFDPFSVYSFPNEEDVAIHCLVNACSVHSAPSPMEGELSLKEGQNAVDFEGMPVATLPNNYTNEKVIDFVRRGDLPDFTAYTAIEIIREEEVHKCEVLKILCTEYLMRSTFLQKTSERFQVLL